MPEQAAKVYYLGKSFLFGYRKTSAIDEDGSPALFMASEVWSFTTCVFKVWNIL